MDSEPNDKIDNRDVFNRIAPGWYNFRHWSIFQRELAELAERWHEGKLLNLGCGHGPDFLPFRSGFELYGVDFSQEMLELARKYAQKFDFQVNLALSDIISLPFKDEAFDWAIAVASYHHIKGQARQEAALSDLRRVLKPGGEAFITVWNRWQTRFRFGPKEAAVPWRTGDEILERYYYLFSYPELEDMVERVGLRILKSFPESSYAGTLKFFSRNICVLVKRDD